MILKKDRYPYVILEAADEKEIWRVVKKAQMAKGERPGPDGTTPSDQRRYAGIRGEYIVAQLLGQKLDDNYGVGKRDLGYDFIVGGLTVDVKRVGKVRFDASVPYRERLKADVALILHHRQGDCDQITGWCTREEFFSRGYEKPGRYENPTEYCYKNDLLHPFEGLYWYHLKSNLTKMTPIAAKAVEKTGKYTNAVSY